ncbi:MAG: hypothetical protein EOP52_13450 [Sphingobacteriales bacterium]|nr:MAG: hypothetical protein EOP52_13450 [Sphingobacteriales bacterium]
MSFVNSMLPVARNVMRRAKSNRSYESAQAVIDASRRNNSITAKDFGMAGKKRQFKMTYYAPICDVDTGAACGANLCAPAAKIEPGQATFDLSRCTASPVFSVASDDVRKVDGDLVWGEHVAAQLAAMLPQLRKKLARQMLTLILANAGKHLDGTSGAKTVAMANSANASLNPSGLFKIEREFSDGGYEQPFVIGGGVVDTWRKSVAIGGLNAQGQRIDSLRDRDLYYDALTNEVINAAGYDSMIAFDPQVFKFIPWSKNAGRFATDLSGIDDINKLFSMGGPNRLRGSFLDPVLNILWDLNVRYDDCEDVYNFEVELQWDIFFLPADVCNIAGVNGIMRYQTCPEEEVVC